MKYLEINIRYLENDTNQQKRNGVLLTELHSELCKHDKPGQIP